MCCEIRSVDETGLIVKPLCVDAVLQRDVQPLNIEVTCRREEKFSQDRLVFDTSDFTGVHSAIRTGSGAERSRRIREQRSRIGCTLQEKRSAQRFASCLRRSIIRCCSAPPFTAELLDVFRETQRLTLGVLSVKEKSLVNKVAICTLLPKFYYT